jgi:hypothetical protein
VRELVKIREKLGIRSGGLPPCCASQATNTSDVGGVPVQTAAGVVSSQDIEPLVRDVLSMLFPLAHGKIAE